MTEGYTVRDLATKAEIIICITVYVVVYAKT
jgi:hypothetical protein